MKRKEGMVENLTLGSRVINIFLGLILLLIGFCSIAPMWHVLMSALSDGKALFAKEGLVLLPAGTLNFDGFLLVLKDSSILRSYVVTVFYVIGNVVFGIVLNVLAGYVLCHESKLKKYFILILIVSVMFSGGLIPSYMINKSLGLVGSPLAVILPTCTNAMFMIMMMNSFQQVPVEIVEAAKIDGAGHIALMFKVMLPQARGMALVTAINTALGAWNAWYEASIYLPRNKEWWPLQMVIRDLTSRNKDFLNYASPNYNMYLVQFVVIVIASFPVLIALPFFQSKLEENMMVGGVKG